MTTNEIRKFIARILCEGVQLSPDAIEFIVQSNNIDQITNQIIGKLRKLTRKPLILTSETIAELLHIKRETVKLRIDAKEVKEDIEIVFNASDVINSEGNIDDFISHFISRFKKIRRIILRERFDARGTITIREAKRIIKKYNLENNVKLLPRISREALHSFIKCKAELVIMEPIWPEPLGGIPIEANKLGVPAIVSNRGGLPETIKNDVTGYIATPSPDSFSKMIIRALDRTWNRQEIIKIAHNKFNALKNACLLLDFFYKMLR